MFETFLNDDLFTPFRHLDGLLGRRALRPWGLASRRVSFPLVNVYTAEHEALITAEVPGIRPDELEITVEENTLTLSGSRPQPEAEEGERLLRKERGSGRFTKAIQLPFRVDSEDVQAQLKNGVLELRLKRPEADRPRKIKVQITE